MSDALVNLDQVGVLGRVARSYHDNAESQIGTGRDHLARMEGAERGFRGAAGTAFQDGAQVGAANHGALARQIAEQARRAVLAEVSAVRGDEDGDAAQRCAGAALADAGAAMARPVNV